MEREHYVYALFRPDDGQIFHIGVGKNDESSCINDLGYPDIPVVFVRDGMTRAEARELELALICAISRHPHGPLLNVTASGDGSLGIKRRKSSSKQVAKMSAALTGRKLPLGRPS